MHIGDHYLTVYIPVMVVFIRSFPPELDSETGLCRSHVDDDDVALLHSASSYV